MYLRSLSLTNFRSCANTTIRFDETLTIVTGENNAGKTNIVDALRLTTTPSEPRRSRYLSVEDVRLGTSRLKLELEFAGLDAAQQGLFFSMLRSNDAEDALWQLSWAPPTGLERRRGPSWTVGPRADPEVEGEVRDYVRHVYLPALRDAERDLASSSPGRIEFLLRQLLLQRGAEQESLLRTAREASSALLNQPTLVRARDRVRHTFAPLAAGFQEHQAHLRFAEPTLIGLARDLRFSLTQQGLDPSDLAQTGLGYSNLLYVASVLVELELAKDAELTLLLVEEPEAHLHPQLQRALLSFLEAKAVESKRPSTASEHAGRVQVIVTTHSPNLAAATSVRKTVVLRVGPRGGGATLSADSSLGHPSTSANEPATPVTTDHVSESPPLQGALAPSARTSETVAIAVAELGLKPEDERKLDRYLDVTKASLLFGRRVLLLEGIAEALLIPELAACVLNDAEMARFRAATVVAIEGVDFEPYVRILLGRTGLSTVRIADRVVIVTDEDPPTQGQAPGTGSSDLPEAQNTPFATESAAAGFRRKQALEALAYDLDVGDLLHVELSADTLEAALLSDSLTGEWASPFACAAFAACVGGTRRAAAWAERIDALAVQQRGSAFVDWMKTTGTRKGDFAQVLASVIEEKRRAGTKFLVPPHIVRALRALVG